MIKAIMLILEPKLAWDGIAVARKSFAQVLLLFLLPVVLLSVAGELAGLVYLRRHPDAEGITRLPMARTIEYGATEVVLSFVMVFLGAMILKSIAETFQSRHSFARCFTVVAYAFSPLFLARLLDAFPAINPWASFGIGMILCIATLYHGIPRVLAPEPTYAFGLYLVSMLLLTGMAALVRFLTWLVLTGKLHKF